MTTPLNWNQFTVADWESLTHEQWEALFGMPTSLFVFYWFDKGQTFVAGAVAGQVVE